MWKFWMSALKQKRYNYSESSICFLIDPQLQSYDHSQYSFFSISFIKKNTFFLEYQVDRKLSRQSSHTFLSSLFTISSSINIWHQYVHILQINETILMHYSLNPIVNIRIHPLCGTVSYLGVAKCMKTCSHHYNIILNSFMTLRFSVFYLFCSPYSPAPTSGNH